ncbi:MAG: amidohydrolase family protein [Pseudomonadales bacterium]
MRFSTIAIALSILWLTHAVAESTDNDKDDKKHKWNVSQPAFSVAPKSVAIDVDRGTWMSLDVSPDGKTIAFDLLGDIYLLPMSGGEARNISAGFHWDMQPRFSPDGRHIAFTSDRDGGDNIWIMDVDGANGKQISKEKFRLLNNPAWSPDGRFIAARKHFTTERSLGSGEIWLYDIRGGKGVQVVKRPNEAFQKELGEPMYTPDGAAIYYSQNVTPGDIFIYAQDSNKESFRIRKFILDTGETEDVAGGPGGAVRPAPSPDGRWLAYVKRVRAKSRLFVKDLVSGEERMLVDSLDQDMQETWAVHGVYPNMDWTPDSSSIVFWRDGRINRVILDSGEVVDINFRVKDDRVVYTAPRHDVEVAPNTFKTRMPRWAQTRSADERVFFESLGRIYVKAAGDDSTPQRLSKDSGDYRELYPTLSSDGRWVYFVSWADEDLGTIRRVSSRGGRSQALTRTPGHYRDIAISPNGATLAVRLGAGGGLLSPLYSTQPGIYTMPAKGGALTLVTKDGEQPHFGASSDRLYVVRSHTEDKLPWRKLTSIALDGKDPRDLVKTQFAREIRVAPDDSHVLFIENYQLFVAPLPRTGQMLVLGPKAEGVPIKKASGVGGEYGTWSDANTVHWSIGPEFKSAGLTALYADDYTASDSGVSLSIEATADKPAGVVAFTNARIVTMDDTGVIANGTVVVRDNRIEAIGKDVPIPAEAKQVDLAGKTLVPGFIDIHAHGPYGQERIIPQQNWSALGHLAFGVTTVHDPSSSASHVFPAAEYQRAGLIVSPRTYSTGEIVYGAKEPLFAPIDGLEDALAHIRRLKAQGAISVKNYNQPRRSQRQQVVEAARQEEVMVVAEGGALYHMDLNLVADGNTGIEHSLPQLAIYDDVVQFWSQTNVGYTPTLVVGFGTIQGEDYWYQHDDVWKHPILSHFVPPAELQAQSVRRQKAPEEDYWQAKNAAIGKQLADAGVIVNTGAHGQREGLGTHWELWMFVQGGYSPLEALQAATIRPAQYLALDKDLGSITAGKLADLIVIDGDVTKDIRVSDQITHVMLNGRLYEVPTLNETVTGERERKPFYWEGRPESDIR